MHNSKHTKGPWKVSCQLGGGSELKTFHTITDSENRLFVALADTRASAQLISAAPEMLNALEEYCRDHAQDSKDYYYAVLFRQILKKARGET